MGWSRLYLICVLFLALLGPKVCEKTINFVLFIFPKPIELLLLFKGGIGIVNIKFDLILIRVCFHLLCSKNILSSQN